MEIQNNQNEHEDLNGQNNSDALENFENIYSEDEHWLSKPVEPYIEDNISTEDKVTVFWDGGRPYRSTKTAKGLDLTVKDTHTIPPHCTDLVGTGTRMTWFGSPEVTVLLYGRSKLFAEGLLPITGVIDPDYCQEIFVPIHNPKDKDHLFEVGERIAQLIIITDRPVKFVKLRSRTFDRVSEAIRAWTGRSHDGLGSTDETDPFFSSSFKDLDGNTIRVKDEDGKVLFEASLPTKDYLNKKLPKP